MPIAKLEVPITLVTWGSKGGPFPRLIRWMSQGLAEKERKVDILFVQDARSVKQISEKVREIGLGTRARWAMLPLMRYFKEVKPSLVIATPAHVAPVALIAGRFTRTPVVPWEPTLLSYDKPFLPRTMRLSIDIVRKTVYRWAPVVAATSKDVAEEVHSELGCDVFVLPNPCDLDEIRRKAALGQDKMEQSNGISMVAVGRLIRQKGIDVILRALHRLIREGVKGWTLNILGDGPERDEYQRLCVNLGLQDRVNFLGYVPNPYPYMVRADIFVHAARWEGFGMVVVEAMALELPIIATDCPGGPKEILDYGKAGILVPSDDPESLAHALARLISNPGERERLGKAARERVEIYRPERVAERVLEIEDYVRTKGNGKG